MNNYYDREKDNDGIWGMTAFDDTGIIGHFTMRFTKEGSFEEIRLGFVIVDDEKRGRGYGREMVSLALQYAFDFVKVSKVSLEVFENNMAAVNCYRVCGFREVERETAESYLCMGETWNCIEMEAVRGSRRE